MTQVKHKTSDWEKLSIRLIKEIQSIFIAVFHFTEDPENNTKEKLYKLKEIIDSKPDIGIFSGTSLLSVNLDDKTTFEKVINQFVNNIKKE